MEGVSAFIVGTCQIHPKLLGDVFDSMQFDILHTKEILGHSLHCGSSAEFYIKPINKSTDDLDFMKYTADILVYTEDIPVLPEDFRSLLDTITCFQIMPNPDYPGFVEFRDFLKIKYNWRWKQFEFQQTYGVMDGIFRGNLAEFFNIKDIAHETGGPAVKLKFEGKSVNDIVLCYWCPQWPKEAKHWPFRRRNCGWPTIADIRQIVQNGCHVVCAKHPECRNDVRQWRLSFSGAELYLIQSWKPVQQIVYHLLRFFAKIELFRKDYPKEDEVLCSYHLKTLMLWSCEEDSPESWNSMTVIEKCCNLLLKLTEWLKKGYCPNYFIPQANLFHKLMNQRVVDETIWRLNEFCHINILNGWFAVKYIQPILNGFCAAGDTTETMINFDCWALGICEFMNAGKLIFFDWQFSHGFWLCAVHLFQYVLVERGYTFHKHLTIICSFKNCIGQKVGRGFFLSTVEFSARFPQFAKVLFILHAAIALSLQKTTYDSDIFTECVREIAWQSKVVRSKHHNFPKPSKTSLHRSVVLFLKAQDLMENFTGLNSPQEFRLVSQLSKELLRYALKCDNFKSSSYGNAAFVYLAALHFSESDYETAIDLCWTVFINQPLDDGEEQEEKEEEKLAKETLNAGCFFYFDDVVRIIGFKLLLMRIQYNFQYNRRRYLLDLRLTPELFAQYLIISSNERRHRHVGLNYYIQKPTFLLDEILMAVTKRRSAVSSTTTKDSAVRVYQRTDPIKKLEEANKGSSSNVDSIIHLLMEYSLEALTSFYNTICADFDIHCNAAVCYRAAYLYNCRKYSEVLHLCDKIIDEPDLQRNLEELTFANVMVMPPLDSYFDSDIQCLLGLHTLVCYLSPLNEDLCKLEDASDSMFQNYFAREIYFEKHLLSIFLQRRYILKCPYFLGGHFLARYLKVRCLIDCNHSLSEVVSEFKKLKSNLTFEHMIRCFLRRILGRL